VVSQVPKCDGPGAPDSWGGFRIKQCVGGAQNGIGLDGEQTSLGSFVTGVIAAAFRAAQNNGTRAEGSVAGGVGGAIDANHRALEGAGKVERAGITGDGQTDAAGDGDELRERAEERSGRAAGLAEDGPGQPLLAGADVDENAAAASDEGLSDGGVTRDRPAFCAPSGPGVDEDGRLEVIWGKDFVSPGFGGGVDGQPGRDGGEFIAGDGRGQFDVLLDDVCAAGGDALGKEPAYGSLPRFRFADEPLASGEPRQNSGPDGALEIEDGIVPGGLHGYTQSIDFMKGLTAVGGFAPDSGGGEVEVADQGLGGFLDLRG